MERTEVEIVAHVKTNVETESRGRKRETALPFGWILFSVLTRYATNICIYIYTYFVYYTAIYKLGNGRVVKFKKIFFNAVKYLKC